MARRTPHLCIPPFSWNPTPSGGMHSRGLLTPDYDSGRHETDPSSGKSLAVSGAVYLLRAWASNRMEVNGAWKRGALHECTQGESWTRGTPHPSPVHTPFSWKPTPSGGMHRQGLLTPDFGIGLSKAGPTSGTMLAVSGAVYPLRAWASNRTGVNGTWNRGALPEYTQVAP